MFSKRCFSGLVCSEVGQDLQGQNAPKCLKNIVFLGILCPSEGGPLCRKPKSEIWKNTIWKTPFVTPWINPVAPVLPPHCHNEHLSCQRCRGSISKRKRIALHGGVAATLGPLQHHLDAKESWESISRNSMKRLSIASENANTIRVENYIAKQFPEPLLIEGCSCKSYNEKKKNCSYISGSWEGTT